MDIFFFLFIAFSTFRSNTFIKNDNVKNITFNECKNVSSIRYKYDILQILKSYDYNINEKLSLIKEYNLFENNTNSLFDEFNTHIN